VSAVFDSAIEKPSSSATDIAMTKAPAMRPSVIAMSE